MIRRSISFLLLSGLVALTAPVASQPPTKRPLSHADYPSWNAIQAPVLSPDGSHVAYAIVPQEGDGEFIVRNLATGKTHRHTRGGRGATATPTGRGGRAGPGGLAPSAHLFGPDGKTVLFPIYPPTDRKAAEQEGSTAPVNVAMGILDLGTGKATRIERVRRYQVASDGPAVVAYLKTEEAPARDPSKGAGSRFGGRGASTTAGQLVVRNLADGKERTFADVTEFTLTRDGQLLAFVVAGKKEDANGVYAVSTTASTPPVPLRSGPGRYARLTWDARQTQLAFFHTRTASGDSKSPASETRLCHWKRGQSVSWLPLLSPGLVGLSLVALQNGSGAVDLVPNGKAAFQAGMQMNDQADPSFSSDGNHLYFTVAASASPGPSGPNRPGAPARSTDRAVVELWHYQDDFIQPMQKARYNPRPTYPAVFDLTDRTSRQLGDESLTQVQPANSGNWMLGLDDRAYRPLVGSQEAGALHDAYLIDRRSGTRKPVLKRQIVTPTLSPGGKYVLSFDGKNWHTQSTADGKSVDLTSKLGVSFVAEEHDQASAAPPHGVAGWTVGDQHVLLYDRYDLWLVAPDGSSAKNVTAGIGRKTTTILRLVRPESTAPAINPEQMSGRGSRLGSRATPLENDKPLLVRAENETTRDSGFYRVWLTGASPKLLIMGARNYGTPVKAAKADRYFLTVSTFYDFPDLYVADGDFHEVKKVSEANPQKQQYVWGKAELIRYRNADGLPLSGVLIKPENFDPKKQYPMIVYIYERLSQNLHRFVTPQPGTSINPTYYASNGYLVLMPDIAYTVGHPGQSAVKCVLPAVQAVVDQGCVDENAIGIQGHSWGGYQTAYLITQTTRFKAASAGAPVSNMTSAYGGIRWGTGLPRQFQYEKTQSRIGGSLWDFTSRFLENSPLFHAPRIQTPLLMLHNDQDEAVPFEQGIEYYLALRRLGKEVYLFNYPGEAHGLRRRVNQKDYTERMQQFFDVHLKKAAKPEWMVKGQPYTRPAGEQPTFGGRRNRGGPPATTGTETEQP